MSKVLDQFGKPLAMSSPITPSERQVRARFDTQFTTDENRRHFAMADAMSVDASASWMVRRILRMRNRYEYHNNSYYTGIADLIGDYVIGTGPRLQMMSDDKKLNKAIELIWEQWAEEIRLADVLRNSRIARIYNGEGFQLLRTNPGLENPVKLDVFEIEADQVSSPLFGLYPAQYPDQYFDGLVLDPWGNPKEYHVLRQHPGAFGAFVIMGYEFDKWPANYVIHDYKRVRPAQRRGIPEANPALPLFAFLRDYTLAVVGAAETAADFAAVAQTTAPPDETDTFAQPMTAVELRRRMMTFLPEGYQLGQIKAEQPTTTYEMFVNAILREICRCMNVPLVFGSLDATHANMSSSYVVTQPFIKSVDRDRAGYERNLNRILALFLQELNKVAANDAGVLEQQLPPIFPHRWLWPSTGNHADPDKVASAQETKLRNGTTNRAREYANQGMDVDEEDKLAADSQGITVDEYREKLTEAMFADKQPQPGQTGDKKKPEPSDRQSAPSED